MYVLIGFTTGMMSCMQGEDNLQRCMAACQQLEQQLAQEVVQRQELQQQLQRQSNQSALIIAELCLQQQHSRLQLLAAQERSRIEQQNSSRQQLALAAVSVTLQRTQKTSAWLCTEVDVARGQLQQEKVEPKARADRMQLQIEQLQAQLDHVREGRQLATAAATEAAKVCNCALITLSLAAC